jgi:hypothetical protein
MTEVIIISWVDKYCVNRYQKSTIVLLNDVSCIIYHLICANINVKCVVIGSEKIHAQSKHSA